MQRRTLSESTGAPDLTVREHLWACGVIFFGGFALAAVPMLRAWEAVAVAVAWEAWDSVFLQPLVGLVLIVVGLQLLRLPLTLFVWLVPARCPKCDGTAFARWDASLYVCDDCRHRHKTSCSIG